ncbi:MAG: integrin alpha, partial [Solirubrobacteraceae bacterium]|nr:integrin alpha [Solirubrobacteraceae bacterium]
AVLFGKGPLDPPNDPVDLAAAIGAGRGFLVEGPPGDAFAGEGVAEIAPAGDIDGDGLSDIVVGGPREDPLGRVDAGTAWLVFGRPGPAFVDLTRLGYDGLHLAGPVAGGLLGGAADAIGAADADGRPDLLVGAPQLTALGRTSAGAVFQLSGAALPRPLPPGTDPGPGPGGGGPGGGGPGAGAPPPAAAADRSAPALSAVSLRPRRFKAGKAPRGTTIRWTLSEPAATTFTIERLSPGRRAGKRCAAPTARNRRARACVRTTPAGRLRANGRAGANRLRFTGRVGRRTLRPGSYRLTARATDAAGNASARRTATFTLTR